MPQMETQSVLPSRRLHNIQVMEGNPCERDCIVCLAEMRYGRAPNWASVLTKINPWGRNPWA